MPYSRNPMLSRLDGGGVVADSDWTGLAYITDGNHSGSGVLSSSGLHILTAAHVVDDFEVEETKVTFPFAAQDLAIQDITIHPGAHIAPTSIDHDLASIALEQSASPAAERYHLYEQQDELGQNAIITGYGQGEYPYGSLIGNGEPTLRHGINRLDATAKPLASWGWEGSLQEQLVFDYDDGSLANDSLGEVTGERQLGLGEYEAMLTPGDSGGGLFVPDGDDWLLAGLNSYTVGAGEDATIPLGDIGAATRISEYTEWILQETGQHQEIDAQATSPPAADDVPREVEEGSGVYFLVEIPGGAAQDSSVEFFTRDGIAQAGLDYIPTKGEIEFEAGDTFAKVWVQILTDDQIEGDENFELVLTNPQGADFPEGKTELTASRVITEDGVQLAGVTELQGELFGEAG